MPRSSRARHRLELPCQHQGVLGAVQTPRLGLGHAGHLTLADAQGGAVLAPISALLNRWGTFFTATMATGTRSLCLLLVGLILAGLPAPGVTVPGGIQNIPVTDPEVRAATIVAVGAFNQDSDSPFVFRAEKVISAQSQVVEGFMYYLTVELEKTLCRKGEAQDPQACPLAPADQQQGLICKFQVWSRPWLSDTQVMSQSCVPAQA
ncbi:cystatin [Alligator mississippiensis]|uniref:cystatin n=1 Tax=Alligator mississippiensis TaxID=8496 RepID=UPI002877A2DE|nr:cystatin [Alligator mississippiensis]